MKTIIGIVLIAWLAASCSGASSNHTMAEDSSTLNKLKETEDKISTGSDSVSGVPNAGLSPVSGSTGSAGTGSGVTSPGTGDSTKNANKKDSGNLK